MKRVLLLCVCLVLTSVATANADSIFGIFTNPTFGDSVTLNYTRTHYGTYDEIDLKIGAITAGLKANGLGAATGAQTSAEFTACPGSMILTDWTNYKVTYPKGGPTAWPAAPHSAVAFDQVIDAGYPDGTYASDGINAATWNDTWYATNTNLWLGVGGILAKIYTNPNGSFRLHAGISLSDGKVSSGFGGPIFCPEPASVLLLAAGLIVLLPYAWRRRK
jgi:hypothetical protein